MHISEKVLPLIGSRRALVAGCFFIAVLSGSFKKIIKGISAELTMWNNVAVM